MIGAYILFLFLFILSFGITSVIILSFNTLHGTRRDEGHSTWFLKLVILFMCIASFKITYNIIDKNENLVKAKNSMGFYTKLDLGIVKYHFEVGANKKVFNNL